MFGAEAPLPGDWSKNCPTSCKDDPDPECKRTCYCAGACVGTVQSGADAGQQAIDQTCYADCLSAPGVVSGATILQLGQQLTNGQQCVRQNGEIYCLSKHSYLAKEKYIYLAVGIAGGMAVGALLGYMIS